MFEGTVLIASVLIGGAASWAVKTDSIFFRLSLAFSGAFLFGTIILHLIPDLYRADAPRIGLWVLLGFGIQLFLDFISKGLEHGHFHAHGSKLPLLPLFGLFLHAMIEGMPLAEHGVNHDHSHHGTGLIWSIALHKMPIALLVTAALRKAKIPTVWVAITLLIFAISTPLGSFAGQFLSDIRFPILGVATGLLLHVSTTILFETSANHQFNAFKLISVAIGILLSIIILN